MALVMLAVALVGAFVAVAFFVGLQEQRMGERARRTHQALGVAEVGAYETLRSWNAAPRTAHVPIAEALAPGATGSYGGALIRMSSSLYFADISGSESDRTAPAREDRARARVGLLLSIQPLPIAVAASLTTRGPLRLEGSASIDGMPHTPPGWIDCDGLPDSARAGVRVADRHAVSGEDHASGAPPLFQDSTVTRETFTRLGDVSYAALSSRAAITLPPSTYATGPRYVAGKCDVNDPLNWGDGMDRAGDCANYYPIVHVTGDLVLSGGQGQGILLVDGDLAIQGPYEFYGLAIVRGSIQTSGRGTRIWGGVQVENSALELQVIGGDTRLSYSKCAITRVLESNGALAPLRTRSWVQLFR